MSTVLNDAPPDTPATEPAVRSGALGSGCGATAATWVSGAVGKAVALLVVGVAGGGSCWLDTWPEGAAGKGAGCVFSD